jgi:hypothetical protein
MTDLVMLVHKKSTLVPVMQLPCMVLTLHRNFCRSDDSRMMSWWYVQRQWVTDLSRQSPFGAVSCVRLHMTPGMPLTDAVGVAEEAVGEEEGSFSECEVDE